MLIELSESEFIFFFHSVYAHFHSFFQVFHVVRSLDSAPINKQALDR